MTPVESLCNLPRDFRQAEKSAGELADASGIEPDALSTASVAAVLRSNPALVDDWLGWSQDQRSTPGYYFLEEDGKYVVGRCPGTGRVTFDDPFEACADFIVKWVRRGF